MRIDVFRATGDGYAQDVTEGVEVAKIVAALLSNSPGVVEIDFAGVIAVERVFLFGLFNSLYLQFSVDELHTRIRFKNLGDFEFVVRRCAVLSLESVLKIQSSSAT